MTYTHRHRVRYRECDPMGVVYHAHVVDWFEAARTEALREAGLPYRELEESGIIMPVVGLEVAYRSSVYYDDLVEVAREDGVLGADDDAGWLHADIHAMCAVVALLGGVAVRVHVDRIVGAGLCA